MECRRKNVVQNIGHWVNGRRKVLPRNCACSCWKHCNIETLVNFLWHFIIRCVYSSYPPSANSCLWSSRVIMNCTVNPLCSSIFQPTKVSYYSAYDAHIATAPQHIPTQHDMLPQPLVWKYELNCEYCNITLAKNKAPWWWSDKIETCRSVLKRLKCFKSALYEIICEFVGW